MTKEGKLPKFPKNAVYDTKVLDWTRDMVVELEERLKPIEKAIKDIHSRDESTWGIGTTINLGVLQDKASLLSEFIKALK